MPLKLFNFQGKKILVIGDIMLDEYWLSDTNRISQEAPVPIALIKNYDYRAGGAANVALNIAAFGIKVDLLGLTGTDITSKTLSQLLQQQELINNLIITTKDQPTINKIRIISNNQQIFRIDKEEYYNLNNFNLLLEKFNLILKTNHYDAIVLSDYNKGSLQKPELLISVANQYNIPVIIDPKNHNYNLYKNAYLLKPNLKEFKQIVNYSLEQKISQQEINQLGHNLINNLNLTALIITQGANGISLLTKDYQDQHFTASQHEVFDVSGAGDTVLATISACFAANKEKLNIATQIATIAAGINVSKVGTACINLPELQLALTSTNTKTNTDFNNLKLGIIDKDSLSIIIKQQQLLGEVIVLINGCFDVLHLGHVQYIKKAKSLGNRLVIAINDDASIKSLKGPTRPINCLEHRMALLAALKEVDWVVPFNHVRPGNLIEALNPNILVKTKEAFKTIEEIPAYEGAEFVLKQGGQVVLLDRPIDINCDTSSSKIIEEIKTC